MRYLSITRYRGKCFKKCSWVIWPCSTVADPCDEPSFHAGLYDGLMREPRGVGKAVPRRAPKRKKGRAKKKAAPIDPTVRPHPYSVGLELGAQTHLGFMDLRDAIKVRFKAVKICPALGSNSEQIFVFTADATIINIRSIVSSPISFLVPCPQ